MNCAMALSVGSLIGTMSGAAALQFPQRETVQDSGVIKDPQTMFVITGNERLLSS